MNPKSPKHSDFCTHIDNKEDKDILTRKLFDVNMRLFKTSQEYKNIVLHVCEYLKWSTVQEKEGYKRPHGWSGANAGIPFNIICVMNEGRPLIMINPRMRTDGEIQDVRSNCGSLTLTAPVTIYRQRFTYVEFYNEEGKFCEWHQIPPTPGFTIQHEVEHNLGILITDKPGPEAEES